MSDHLPDALYWNPQALLSALAERGEAPALLEVVGESTRAVSGAALAADAMALARGLVAAGIAPREPVALVGPNSAAWVTVRFAIAAAGAMAVPLDDQTAAEELRARIGQAGCRLVFATAAHLAELGEAPAGEGGDGGALRRFALDETGPHPGWRSLLSDGTEALPEIAPDQPAVIVFTSGTTGTPKRFTLSYANIGANVAALAGERLAGPQDRFLLPLPLDNIYPYVVGLLTPLSIGALCVFPEALTGPQIAQALKASRATVLIGVPRLYEAVVAGIESRVAARGGLAPRIFGALLWLSTEIYRRSGRHAGRVLFGSLHARFGPELRLMISGGARLTGPLSLRLEALGWEALGGYGLAEVCSVFTRSRPERKRAGSQGYPLPNRELRIAEPDADGDGEIQLHGPNVFSGYLDDPAANEAAFTEDGWFRTGDLGHLDKDGFLFVTGRLKEVIVMPGGRNIFPEQVEAVYGRSPYLQEIALLESDGRLVALVRPDEAAIMESGNARVEDVVRVALTTAAAGLPSFQRLSGFAMVRQELPRNRLGKYQRFKLEALYRAARQGRSQRPAAELSAEDQALWDQPLSRQIVEWLGRRYPDKPLDPDVSLQLDMSIDSLEWVNLTLDLERWSGLRLGDEQVAEILTLRDLLVQAGRATPAPEASGAAPGTPDAEAQAWLAPRGPLLGAARRLLAAVNWLLMKAFFRLRVEGGGQVPADAGCIFVANHASDLDPLVLAAALPRAQARRVYWGGVAGRLFGGRIRHIFCRIVGIFPVDDRAPAKALALAETVLARGDSLAWFPESWRSPDGEVQAFRPGVGRLLQRSGVVAVPVHIHGTFEAMPRWRRWPKPSPVTVVFGSPRRIDPAPAEEDSGDPAQRLADSLRDQVIALRPTG